MTPSLTGDLDLPQRYDRPGPRYTAYPTAPQFGPLFSEEMLREYIHRSNEEPIPPRLSLYIHVPCCSNRVITWLKLT